MWELPRGASANGRTSVDLSDSPSTATAASMSPQTHNASPLHQRKDDHAHRKRNRIVLSCVQCRRRKLKCDRQFPCGACTRRGAADECLYQRHDKGKVEDSGVLERRMETLEKLVRGLVGETALQQIKDGSYDSGGSFTHEGEVSSGEDANHPTTKDNAAPETLNNLNLAMGQLTILPESEGGTLYAGGTAWDSVFAQFAELKQLLKQARDQGSHLPEIGPAGIGNYGSEASTVSYLPSESFHAQTDDVGGLCQQTTCFPFSNFPPPSIADAIALLPSKKLTLILIDKFFNSLLPFNKIVHSHTFMKEYQEFLKSPQDVKPGWLALLFTMLVSSVVSYSPALFSRINDSDMSQEQTSRALNNGAKAALVHAQFLKSHTLPVVQALCLLQFTVNPDEMAVSSWALHGATKNLALQMGLHREPSLFKIPEPEAEIRRRVWWCIYIQDRLSCVNHGIAVSWQDSDMDCREPLIVNDDQLTSDLAEKRHTYPSGTDAPFCSMTIFYGQLKVARLHTHVIQIAFGLKRTNYSKIMKLDEEAETFRRDLAPKILRSDHPNYEPGLETISLVMRCFHLKVILLLHRPFIGRARENEQFKWSRDRAVDAALTIIKSSAQFFVRSNMLLENYYPASPMLAHGLFPAPIALALDLYTWPDQPNPEPSRQALLEQRRIYLSLGKQFVAVKRLYKILNCLMAKAWEKAGLTVPTEDVASRVGTTLSSSTSTPSPLMGNYDNTKYGPQGVVPTSFQQFHSHEPYPNWQVQGNQGDMMPVGPPPNTHNPMTWDPNNRNLGNTGVYPLFGSDTSSSQFTATPQLSEYVDMDNSNGVWVLATDSGLTVEPK